MAQVVILTDSAADIDQATRSSLGIEMVPLKVIFGQESFLDSVTMNTQEFFVKLKGTDVQPTTSQPSPLDFLEAYKQIVEKHGKDVQIICLLLSAALSGTYQSAVIAKTMLEEEIDITIIDSKKASFIHGIVTVEAARAVHAGKSKQQILDLIERLLRDIQVYFIVDTLEFLQRGGRIGKAQAMLGSLLNIKPILSLDPEGQVFSFDKVRGTKKAIGRMLEELTSYAGKDSVKVAILHAEAIDEAKSLLERVKEEFTVTETFIQELGPVIGTHTGPGTLACVMIKTASYQ
ncbi:DegV family protein [Brevibacillus sp. SYSU BS000544]|uniref:DegV family protein n=1 Tax=Brevibacillus sp. SYSU BS000544 TaxID=3416443 RepID=UPI003CE51068